MLHALFKLNLWLRHVFSFVTPGGVITSAVFMLHIYSSEMKDDLKHAGGWLLVITDGGAKQQMGCVVYLT